jgi:preprotein translocase subunit SecD
MIARRSVVLALALSPALAVACARAAPPAASPGPARFELRAEGDRLVLDGQVRGVRVVADPERSGRALAVDLDDRAQGAVTTFTTRHVGQRLAVLVAGREVMTPTLRDPITGPSIMVTGHTDADVEEMRRALVE